MSYSITVYLFSVCYLHSRSFYDRHAGCMQSVDGVDAGLSDVDALHATVHAGRRHRTVQSRRAYACCMQAACRS